MSDPNRRLPPAAPDHQPPGTKACTSAGDDCRPRQPSASALALPVAHEVDRSGPVGGYGPREPQLSAPLAKIVGQLRKLRRIDPEQQIERFDLDVDPLGHRRGEAPQLREATADRHLANRCRSHSDGRREAGNLFDEARGNLVPGLFLPLAWPHGRHGIHQKSPGQFSRGNEGTFAHERHHRHLLFERNVGFECLGNRNLST